MQPKYDFGHTKPATDAEPVPGGKLQGIIQFLRCPREGCKKTAGYQYPAPEGILAYECCHCHLPFTLEEE